MTQEDLEFCETLFDEANLLIYALQKARSAGVADDEWFPCSAVEMVEVYEGRDARPEKRWQVVIIEEKGDLRNAMEEGLLSRGFDMSEIRIITDTGR
jgi:hypothetical protein